MDESYSPYLQGKDVGRYILNWSGEYLKYGDNLAEPRKSVSFDAPRILIRQIPSKPPYSINGVYTEQVYLNDINSMVIYSKNSEYNLKIILGILNSKLITYWFVNKFDKFQRKTFPQFKVNELKNFPISFLYENQQKTLINLVDEILTKNKQLHTEIESFHKYLISDYNLIKINKKLGEYYQLNFDELYKEVKKSYKKITRTEKDILEKEFKESLDIINPLRKEINSIDKEIDKIVYELYDLTEEEIAIIEK
jgi:hypothetical protein